MLSVVSDVPADSEAPVLTCESQDLLAQSFEGAHKDMVYVCVFIKVNVRACCERLRCTV